VSKPTFKVDTLDLNDTDTHMIQWSGLHTCLQMVFHNTSQSVFC